LNETLRRALLRARLSEEDVAARLEVDPKTVRRWLEGRMPYLRHRWALAGVLGLDEADLWPQLRAARSRPDAVRAIYPSRDAVPREVWQRLFGSARRDIGILACNAVILAEDPGILGVLAARGRAGVRVRICVRDPPAPDVAADAAGQGTGDAHWPDIAADAAGQGTGDASAGRVRAGDAAGQCIGGVSVGRVRDALARDGMSGLSAAVEMRLYRDVLYNCIYWADDDLLVGQHAYGIPVGRAPVLHLRGTGDDDMIATYLESFERVWAASLPLE
jgi:transcriptional regulator with XRE-family HTH domain